jgi:hypothetical protein
VRHRRFVGNNVKVVCHEPDRLHTCSAFAPRRNRNWKKACNKSKSAKFLKSK